MSSLQVLQRKTEEASLATKRLKELLESRKTSSRESMTSEIYCATQLSLFCVLVNNWQFFLYTQVL